MAPILSAGLRYFLLVFAAGFVLGAFRVTVLAPAIGPAAAVAAELPLILAIAWYVCGRVTRRIPATGRARLAMGATAFALLMVADVLLGTILGRPPAAQLADLATAAGLLGLAGQIGFGLLPVLRLRLERRRGM